MITVFVVEKPKDIAKAVAPLLIGHYAVRAFASLEALRFFRQIDGLGEPQILIVDADDILIHKPGIPIYFRELLPRTHLVIIGIPDPILGIEGTGKEESRTSILLPKPIDQWTLFAVVESLATRALPATQDVRLKEWLRCEFDRLQVHLLAEGKTVFLSPKECQILKLLVESDGFTVTREVMNRSLWPGLKVSPRTMDSHVSRLRKRLNAASVKIESIYGGGYRMIFGHDSSESS